MQQQTEKELLEKLEKLEKEHKRLLRKNKKLKREYYKKIWEINFSEFEETRENAGKTNKR